MKFEGLIPVIQCGNIEHTLEFYQQALRYIIIKQTIVDGELQWCHLKSDNTYIMLQQSNRSGINQRNSGNIVLHYYTLDITAQHQFMTAKGINVGQIEDTSYHMRQFFVDDPEGNTIVIGQNMKE